MLVVVRKFRSGKRSLEDVPRPGRHSAFDRDSLRKVVERVPRLNIPRTPNSMVESPREFKMHWKGNLGTASHRHNGLLSSPLKTFLEY